MGNKLIGWRAAGSALAALAIVAGGVASAQHLRGHTAATTTPADLVAEVSTASGTVTGGDLTPRLYTPGTDQPSTALPGITAHMLPAGTQVDLVCYFKGQPVAGPAALAATDPFWDETGDLGVSLKAGQVTVVADAFVHTDRPVDQMIPACDTTGGSSDSQTQAQAQTQQQAGQPATQPGTGGCGPETSANGYTVSACISQNGPVVWPDGYVTVPTDAVGGCQVRVGAYYTSGALASSDTFDCKPGKNHYTQNLVSTQNGSIVDWLASGGGVRTVVDVIADGGQVASADSPFLGDSGSHDNAATGDGSAVQPSNQDHRITLSCSASTPQVPTQWVTILFPVSISPSGLATQADTGYSASVNGVGGAFTAQNVTGTVDIQDGGRAVQVHGTANLLLSGPGPVNGTVEAGGIPVSCAGYFTQPFTTTG